MAIAPRSTTAATSQNTGNGGTIPSVANPGIQNGDLILAAIDTGNNAGTACTFSVPTGFLPVPITAGNPFTDNATAQFTVGIGLYYKIAGSNEPATYSGFSSNGTYRSIAAIMAYSGVDTSNPFNATNIAAQPSPASVNRDTPTINVTGTGAWLVGFWGDLTAATTANNGTTRLAATTSNVALTIADSGAAVAAGTQGFTGTAASNNAAVKAILALNPSTTTPPVTPAPVIAYTYDPDVAIYNATTTSNATSHTISPNTGVLEPIDGIFVIPRGTTNKDYTHTATGPGGTVTRTLTVLKKATGGSIVYPVGGTWPA